MLGRLFRRPAPTAQGRRLVLREAPEAFYAVGDVHGCLDLYRALEARILADARARTQAPVLIVLLGDVVDRGPGTAELLDLLTGPAPAGVQRLCLLGNHEQMMLRFLDDPDPDSDWLRFGGLETLRSYGIPGPALDSGATSAKSLRHLLAAHVPPHHREFLRGLSLLLQAGPFILAHAGLAPGLPVEQQPVEALLWGDPGALDRAPLPDRVVVHGHIPAKAPADLGHRIALDTGAYATGRLTAARLRAGAAPVFLST